MLKIVLMCPWHLVTSKDVFNHFIMCAYYQTDFQSGIRFLQGGEVCSPPNRFD